jgi:hypothetical protein
MEKIQEEMDRVNHDLRLLSKFVEKPERAVDLSKLRTSAMEAEREPPVPASARRGPAAPGSAAMQAPLRAVRAPLSAETAAPTVRPEPVADPRSDPRAVRGTAKAYDERFADYLASSFQAARPLRQERAIQRNKAIVMAIVVVILFLWALYRYFLL